MWKYKQSTGQFFDPDGVQVGKGFSGQGECMNNPDKQSVPHLGPLPRGLYTIEEAFDHIHLGPVTMVLSPDESNEMFGRSLFRIHGYAVDNPLTQTNETLLSSHGCICIDRKARKLINASKDRQLEVVA